MNNNIVWIIVFGTIVSLTGTMLGASLGLIVKKPSKRLLGAIVGFSAGLMMSVVMLELIPEAVGEWSFVGTLIFALMGMGLVMIFEGLLQHNEIAKDKNVKVAFMAALALMLHNLPEGVIMGCGFIGGKSLGMKMALIISIHDIPEGIAVAAPLMASKTNPLRILLYAFITAFPTAIGTWIGLWIGSVSQGILSASLAFASGIMLYVVCGEMIPESNKLWDGITSTLGILMGIIIGFIVTNMI